MIGAPVEHAHLFGHVDEIELDGPAAKGLEVYEQQALLRPEHVARVWLAVQKLFGAPAGADRLPQTPVKTSCVSTYLAIGRTRDGCVANC